MASNNILLSLATQYDGSALNQAKSDLEGINSSAKDLNSSSSVGGLATTFGNIEGPINHIGFHALAADMGATGVAGRGLTSVFMAMGESLGPIAIAIGAIAVGYELWNKNQEKNSKDSSASFKEDVKQLQDINKILKDKDQLMQSGVITKSETSMLEKTASHLQEEMDTRGKIYVTAQAQLAADQQSDIAIAGQLAPLLAKQKASDDTYAGQVKTVTQLKAEHDLQAEIYALNAVAYRNTQDEAAQKSKMLETEGAIGDVIAKANQNQTQEIEQSKVGNSVWKDQLDLTRNILNAKKEGVDVDKLSQQTSTQTMADIDKIWQGGMKQLVTPFPKLISLSLKEVEADIKNTYVRLLQEQNDYNELSLDDQENQVGKLLLTQIQGDQRRIQEDKATAKTLEAVDSELFTHIFNDTTKWGKEMLSSISTTYSKWESLEEDTTTNGIEKWREYGVDVLKTVGDSLAKQAEAAALADIALGNFGGAAIAFTEAAAISALTGVAVAAAGGANAPTSTSANTLGGGGGAGGAGGTGSNSYTININNMGGVMDQGTAQHILNGINNLIQNGGGQLSATNVFNGSNPVPIGG